MYGVLIAERDVFLRMLTESPVPGPQAATSQR